MTWYSPGWANQGSQPDPSLTSGWTSQVLTAGAQVQKEGYATGAAITETGTASPSLYGAEEPEEVEAPKASRETPAQRKARLTSELAALDKLDKPTKAQLDRKAVVVAALK